MTSSGGAGERRPAARVSRATEGRLLGGVCAGLSGVWGLGTNAVRLLFILAAFCGGIGVVIYLACWLVIPADNQDPDTDGTRSVVIVAWATGGLVVLAVLAALGAAATVFGFGWAVVIIAAAVILTAMSNRTKLPRLAALLAVAALTVPAVAVAISPMRLTLQSGLTVKAPATGAEVSSSIYRSGFGTMLIDLRQTRLRSAGTVTLRIHAGLRRTIVALPSDKCVRVRVHYNVHTFTGQLAALVSGRPAPTLPGCRPVRAPVRRRGRHPPSWDGRQRRDRTRTAAEHRFHLPGRRPLRPRLPRFRAPDPEAELARLRRQGRAAAEPPGRAEEGREEHGSLVEGPTRA